MRQASWEDCLRDVKAVAFGDLHLEDLKEFRIQRLATIGVGALFPLWGRDTTQLAHDIIDRGYKATLVSIDASALDPQMLGRPYDQDLLDDLPPGVDPCGENGEFHTFVSSCPGFSRDIEVTAGEVQKYGGFPGLRLMPS